MSGGGDYLRLRKEELAAKRAGATAQKPAGQVAPAMDLSHLKPTPAKLPTPEVEAAVLEEARERGFGRSVGAEDPAPAAPQAVEPPSPKAAPVRTAKPRAGKGRAGGSASQASARYVVSMKERPPADIQGQALFTGNAQVLYEICRRAHYERRPRGELLAEMLELYTAKNGETPETY